MSSEHWETAFTTAYDAYRTAADAVVLMLEHRVPAVPGAHRVSTDIAHAALKHKTNVFGPAISERFRTSRHESEYFDPDFPAEKTEEDAQWAYDHASSAIDAVSTALSAG